METGEECAGTGQGDRDRGEARVTGTGRSGRWEVGRVTRSVPRARGVARVAGHRGQSVRVADGCGLCDC